MSSKIINSTHKNNSFALLIDEMQDNLKDYPAAGAAVKNRGAIAAATVSPIPNSRVSDYIVEHVDISEHKKNSQLLYSKPNP